MPVDLSIMFGTLGAAATGLGVVMAIIKLANKNTPSKGDDVATKQIIALERIVSMADKILDRSEEIARSMASISRDVEASHRRIGEIDRNIGYIKEEMQIADSALASLNNKVESVFSALKR